MKYYFIQKTENKCFYPERVMIPHHPDTYRRIKGYANAGITININGKQRENLWDFNAVKKGNYTKINPEYLNYVDEVLDNTNITSSYTKNVRKWSFPIRYSSYS